MFQGFDTIFQWLINSKAKLTIKTVVFILSVFGIIVVDDLLGFSRYYRINRRIENFKTLTTIISDRNTDPAGRRAAIEIRRQVIESRPVLVKVMDYLHSLTERNKVEALMRGMEMQRYGERNDYWFFFTSSGIWLAVGFIGSLLIFMGPKGELPSRLALLIMIGVSTAVVCYFFYLVFSLIPLILENWIFNYIINLTVQVALFGTLVLWVNKATDRRIVKAFRKDQ